MRALILTNEFPPDIYGGAGVHVDELTRHLRGLVDLDVRTFGSASADDHGWRVRGYPVAHDLAGADARLAPVFGALSRDIGMVSDPVEADVVHVHTWYTHLAGLLARLAYGMPLVLTVHSLEPLRPCCEGTFFVWLALPAGWTAERLLTETRVAVAPGEGFGARGEGHVRLSLAVADEFLDAGLERLRQALLPE